MNSFLIHVLTVNWQGFPKVKINSKNVQQKKCLMRFVVRVKKDVLIPAELVCLDSRDSSLPGDKSPVLRILSNVTVRGACRVSPSVCLQWSYSALKQEWVRGLRQ